MAEKDPNREEAAGHSVNVAYDALDEGIDAVLARVDEGAPGPADEEASDQLEPDAWRPPFYLRFRLLTWAGAVLSTVWLALCAYFIDRQIPWSDISELLPHEIGGMAASVFTPLALLWMVIAFFERGRQLRHESAALRWHFRSMIYPSDRAETRVGEITEALRRQARDLTTASEEALARAETANEMVRRRTLELTQVSGDADLPGASHRRSLAPADRRPARGDRDGGVADPGGRGIPGPTNPGTDQFVGSGVGARRKHL